MICLVCAGDLEMLGVLGRILWARCRDCGLDQMTPWTGNEVQP